MSAPGSKAELIELIERERERWMRLLAAVDERHMLEPGATGEWSFRDVVAHLNGWRERTVARLEAARDDRPPAPPPWPAGLDENHEPDVDSINAWMEQTGRGTPLREVLGTYTRSFDELRAAVEATPEAALLDPSRYAWMHGEPVAALLGYSFDHFHEHEELLGPWLAGAAPS